MSEGTVVQPTAVEEASTVAESILSARKHFFGSKISRWKPRRHYASMLSECTRQLVYAHTHWDQKKMWDEEVQASMEDGKREEGEVVSLLTSLGFEVVEQQVSFDDDHLWVTGKIDGKVKSNWPGSHRRIPFEVKRMNPNTFNQISSLEDFEKRAYLRRYVRQLQIYIIGNNEEAGLFILTDGLGHMKILVVPLDWDLNDRIEKSLLEANKYLDAIRKSEKTPATLTEEDMPPRIPYDSEICGMCPWKEICLPNLTTGAGLKVAPSELEGKIKRVKELAPLTSEYEKLRDEIKTLTEGSEMLVAGSYLVTGKYVESKIKAQPAKEATVRKYWKWEAEPIGKSTEEAASI